MHGAGVTTELRNLFLLLLLANALFFAWAQWVAPPRALAGHPTPSATGESEIRLLREAPLARELSSDSASVDTAASEPILACVSAGPFAERSAVDRASERLQERGFASRLRQAPGEVRVGLWVRIEGFATSVDAENAVPGLRWAGIEDAYVLDEDNGGATISLGIFGGVAGAAEAEKIARDAGFEPVTSERTRETGVFWLDVDRQVNGSLPSLEDVVGDEPGGAGDVELRACAQSGAQTVAGAGDE